MPKIVQSMPPGFSLPDRACAVPGCFHVARYRRAMGEFYCVKHLQRWKKYGDPLGTKRGVSPPIGTGEGSKR